MYGQVIKGFDDECIQFQKQIIKTYKIKNLQPSQEPSIINYLLYQLLSLAVKAIHFEYTTSNTTLHTKKPLIIVTAQPISMINNYVQYQYQPCHMIHQFDVQKRFCLYLGDIASALDLEFIHKRNIRTVVTAAAQMDQVSYKPNDNVKHVIYSVLDHKNQNLIKYFDQFFELIEREIKNGSILVHCAAGISRSSTLVISYLMKKHSWTFKQSIKYVRNNRPQVLPNLGFERQLKEFQKIIIQQENRRLKSKTSQSNKHHQNKTQILPQIGIIGINSTKNKVLEAFRIYKREEDHENNNKRNFMFNNHLIRNDQKVSSLKYQQFQKFKPQSREFYQTKSVSLQQGVDRNLRNTEDPTKISSYVEVKTEQNDIISSRRQHVSRSGLFDSAIIPIKYNTVSKPTDKLKKTNIKFMQLNNNNITINKINMLKQKYSKNSPTLSLGKVGINQMIQGNFKNDLQQNVSEIRGKMNFPIKLSKVKQSQSQGNYPIMVGRRDVGLLKKDIWQLKKESQKSYETGKYDDQRMKKINIKNLLFYQNDD